MRRGLQCLKRTETGTTGSELACWSEVKAGVKEDVQSLKTDMPGKGQRADRRPERSDQDPGLHFDLPPQARRHAAQPRAGRAVQRLPAPAPGQDQSRRGALQLHVGDGRDHFLSVHRAHLHRHAADVLLPPHQGAGLPRHALSRARRAVRQVAAQHASLGRAPDGDHGRGCTCSACF